MCGIVGYQPLTNSPSETTSEAFERLFRESCIRGLHAYGISFTMGGAIETHRAFEQLEIIDRFIPAATTIAHARYSQSGDWRVLENNQPIVVNQTALAFNGCIHMGTKEEFEAAFDVKCTADNDGEIVLRKAEGAETAEEFARTVGAFVESISGSFAGVALAYGRLIVSHNARRPLWTCITHGAKWFASTQDIFKRAGFEGAEPVPVGAEIV